MIHFIFILWMAGLSPPALAATEGMPHMPLAVETRTFTVTGLEKPGELTGFGAAEPAVQAMNLMMVEGPATPDPGAANARKPRPPYTIQTLAPPRTEDRWLQFALLDPITHKPVAGLHLTTITQMGGMKMVAEEVQVDEPEPGLYRAPAAFTMKGSWCVRILSADWETSLCFEVPS